MKITKSYLKHIIKEEITKYESLDKVRNHLESLTSKDQQYNSDPPARIPFQESEAWPFIEKNLDVIFSDKEDAGKWGNCITKAFLLVQHMDNFVENQKKFLAVMQKKSPEHPAYKFLRDRTKVNEWILRNYKDPKYFYKKNPLPQPTVNVRNPKYFRDAGISAKSREEALENARKSGNVLLVAAVEKTQAETQPSYQVKIF